MLDLFILWNDFSRTNWKIYMDVTRQSRQWLQWDQLSDSAYLSFFAPSPKNLECLLLTLLTWASQSLNILWRWIHIGFKEKHMFHETTLKHIGLSIYVSWFTCWVVSPTSTWQNQWRIQRRPVCFLYISSFLPSIIIMQCFPSRCYPIDSQVWCQATGARTKGTPKFARFHGGKVVAFRPGCWPLQQRKKMCIKLVTGFNTWPSLEPVLNVVGFSWNILKAKVEPMLECIWVHAEAVKKPKKGDKLPAKGKLVAGKSMTLTGFGTISPGPNNKSSRHTCFLWSTAFVPPQDASRPRRRPTRSSFPFVGAGTGALVVALLGIQHSWTQPFWKSNSNCPCFTLQDFATQIYHWVDYQQAVRDAQGTPGKYVTPELGEWLHGPTLMIPRFTNPFIRDNNTIHTHTLSRSMSSSGPGIPQGWSKPVFRSVRGDPCKALPWMDAKVWLVLLHYSCMVFMISVMVSFSALVGSSLSKQITTTSFFMFAGRVSDTGWSPYLQG